MTGLASGAPAAEPASVQLKWYHQFQFAGFYAAQEKGYYREQGLEVELRPYRPNVDHLEEVRLGRADFGLSGPELLLRRLQGEPLVVLAAIMQQSPSALMTLADSGLTTPQQLRGKRIMLSKVGEPDIRAMLLNEGLSEGEFTSVKPTWDLGELIDGRIDATAAYLTNTPFALRERGIKVNLIRPINYGVDFYGDCLFTRQEEIDQRPEVVKSFLEATLRGWDYALAHPQEIITLLRDKYGCTKSRAALEYEARIITQLVRPDLVELGHMNPGRWRRMAQIYVDLGLISPAYSLDGFLFDPQYHHYPTWLRWTLYCLGVVAVVSVLSLAWLRHFNRRLQTAVRERTSELRVLTERLGQEVRERRQAQDELAILARFADENPNPVMRVDPAGHLDYHNQASQEFLDLVGAQRSQLLPADLRDRLLECQKPGCHNQFEIQVSERQFLISSSPLAHSDYTYLYAQDVTEHRQLERQQQLVNKVFADSFEGIIIANADGIVEMINPAYTTITGFESHEVVGRELQMLRAEEHHPDFLKDLWQKLMEEGQWSGEYWNRRKCGEAYPEWLTIDVIRDAQGNIDNIVAIFHDITELKRSQEQIRHQAYHDALTGLPNRYLFHDRLEQSLAMASRDQKLVGVVYIDLDNFKLINDSLGHPAGDQMLMEVARRLQTCVREEDTVARLGGDEFTMILNNLGERNGAVIVAERVLSTLCRPMLLEGNRICPQASIGITLYPDDGEEAIQLTRNADIAMYRAKQSGKNNYRLFTETMQAEITQRLRLERDLADAVENGQFQIHYQPKVELRTGRVVGFEALVRWRHPNGDLVPPAEFIRVAEDTGLIVPMGRLVLAEACQLTQTLRDEGYPGLCVSVNLSPRQFEQEDLVEMVQGILDRTGLLSVYLELEITEGTVMKNVDRATNTLVELASHGVRLSLDDFGTGYSSLYYLKRFPISTLKVDRSFVVDMLRDSDCATIVQTIIGMAHSLDLEVVAEGVETEEQLSFLYNQNCDQVQGYLFSRPVPADQLRDLLARNADHITNWCRLD